MRYLFRRSPALLLLALALPAHATAQSSRMALFPTQNRAGDAAASEALDQALRRGLGQLGNVAEPEPTRNALRALRLRNGDRGTPALLQRLGESLGADWLVSVTLHDAERWGVPSASVSLRVYSALDGSLLWARFEGASGLDGRTLLGLGSIDELEALLAVVARKLLESPGPADPGGQRLPAIGRVAVVPFGGTTARSATRHAEGVTEAVQVRLLEAGLDVVSPNAANAALRGLQDSYWGSVTAEARQALLSDTGADLVLTGNVESYEIGGSEDNPDPHVAIAMRLLDAATGRILWNGAEERRGHEGEGLFGLRRPHSRGELAERIVDHLVERLLETKRRAAAETNS